MFNLSLASRPFMDRHIQNGTFSLGGLSPNTPQRRRNRYVRTYLFRSWNFNWKYLGNRLYVHCSDQSLNGRKKGRNR